MAEVDPKPVKVTQLERRLLTVLSSVAWLGCAALLVFVGLRIVHADATPRVATVQSFTPYLLLPSWLALGYAIGARRRALLVVSAFLALTHVVWLYPEIHPSVSIDRVAREAPRLRVFSANLLAENKEIDGLIDEVRAADADIVLLQEYDDGNREAFEASGVFDEYPYRIEHKENSPFGALIASRLPFESSDVVDYGGMWMPTAVVQTPIGPVEVVSVHMRRPVTGEEFGLWRTAHAALADRVRQRTMPLLLGGDYNATTSHRPFRDLLDAGITDANRARGDGLSNSWPNNFTVPTVIRIDHLLSTRELVPLTVRNGVGQGSDHVPLVVDYALVGTRP